MTSLSEVAPGSAASVTYAIGRRQHDFEASAGRVLWSVVDHDQEGEAAMIEIITDLPDHVLGVKASGEVTAEDYRKVLVPALDAKLAHHHRVRLLYVLAEQFNGYSGGAAWEDAKVGMKHLTSFQRVAVVTNADTIRTMVRAVGFALPGEVRVYDLNQLPAAREWVSEQPSPGHLAFRLDRERGLLVLEPKGELEAVDFDRLSAEVDPYLEARGSLKGVAVIADHFPGWDDLSAVASHIKFVRNHHKHVKRVALVTNDRLATTVPRFAKLFISAEVKAFPTDQREAAIEWVTS